MDSRLEQSANAYFPMEVTLFGMDMDLRLEQRENASSPMEVTPFGIANVVNELCFVSGNTTNSSLSEA